MLSKLQKNAKDLIIYSALVSEYERLDFKDDALAGVRANYFNANCAAQNEKTELTISGKPHSLSCGHGFRPAFKAAFDKPEDKIMTLKGQGTVQPGRELLVAGCQLADAGGDLLQLIPGRFILFP